MLAGSSKYLDSKFTIDINSTCEALIYETDGKGLIVLDVKRPVGFINDGDIRRLIHNEETTDNVSRAMNKVIKMKK